MEHYDDKYQSHLKFTILMEKIIFININTAINTVIRTLKIWENENIVKSKTKYAATNDSN